MCGVRQLLPDGAVLNDGDVINADALVLCTGYHYSFPFLPPECQVEVNADNFVTPLYKHVIHCRYPTMSFVGVPKLIIPFPMFDRQARFIVAVLSGEMSLPAAGEMESDVRREFQELLSAGKPPKNFHTMQSAQWAYNDWLAFAAGFEPLPPVLDELYERVFLRRSMNYVSFKTLNYKITDGSSFVETD